MIDFHSHILPNIDDGSRNMEMSTKILEEAKQVGFTKIISTSHYIEQYYETDENTRIELLEDLRKNTQNLGIELYLGNEIYVSNEIVQFIKSKKASTINNTRYVLFELPLNVKPMNAKEVVYRLIENGYIPVIAHPERYSYVKEDILYAKELAEMGTLFQSNYGSIIGLYGGKAKDTLKKLLKEDLIQFLGSDVHRPEQIYPKIPKALKKFRKILSEEKLEQLTTLNAQKVLQNKEL